ncbi:MAG: hypothetical protein AB1405_11295 [Bdellovibrionota bacterium]
MDDEEAERAEWGMPAAHRKEDLKPSDPYYAAWRSHAIYHRIFVAAVAGWFVLVPVAFVLPYKSGAFVLLLANIFSTFVAFTLAAQWRCPRCGKFFSGVSEKRAEAMTWLPPSIRSMRAKGGLSFGRFSCVNCGLPHWAPRDPDDSSVAGQK